MKETFEVDFKSSLYGEFQEVLGSGEKLSKKENFGFQGTNLTDEVKKNGLRGKELFFWKFLPKFAISDFCIFVFFGTLCRTSKGEKDPD